MGTQIEIREFTQQDFERVREIYEQGIATKNATFEIKAPDWDEWNKRFLIRPRLIAQNLTIVAGWAVLSPISTRAVYSGVCEVSVYIDEKFRGMGIGKMLLQKLIDYSERNNIWTLQAGIFPENKGSIKIHQEAGFREVGRRERIGKMDDIWRDTLLFERRSII